MVEKIVQVVFNETGADNVNNKAERLGDNLARVDGENKKGAESSKELRLEILENGGALGLLNDLTGGQAMMLKDVLEATDLFSKQLKIKTGLQKIYTTVVGTSTGALKAFRVALAATGVGALIVLLGFFVEAMASAEEATEAEKRAQELLNIAMEKSIDMLKEQTKGIEFATNARKLRAEIAGASEKELQQIEREAHEERLAALKEEEARLYAIQANKNLTVEQNEKNNQALIANGRAYIDEINAQQIRELSYSRDVAKQKRDDAAKDHEKRMDELKKRQEEELQKAKEFQEKLREELIAFNAAIQAAERDDFDRRLAAGDELAELLRGKRADNALRDLEEEQVKNRILLDEAQATAGQRLELENWYLNRRSELETEAELAHINRTDEAIENEKLAYATRLELLSAQNAEIMASEILTEQQKTQALAENAAARKQIMDAEYEARKSQAEATVGLLNTASAALGDSTALGKGLAVASTTIATLQSSVEAYKGMVKVIPGPAGIAAGVTASGFSILSGFKTIQKILSVKTPGKSGGGSSGGSAGAGGAPSAPPSFNVVAQSGQNQIAQSVAASQNRPVEAFVVGSNVTSQQEMDRKKVQTATFNG